jgi:hypothetical protein
MKNQSGALLHFSGYPLNIAEANQKTKKLKAALAVVRPEAKAVSKKNDLANNPKNWDESWFCNYE